jgi:signal transduction histidine kinase
MGMDEDTRRRLFEPFFTTKGEKGTGLGLWVSRGILRKHHAVIRVRSMQSPGRSGTTFSIWMPVTSLLESEG